MSHVRDMSLAESGRMKIRWVQDFMPALVAIRARFEREKPFAGKKITISIHMEAKTAFLALCLAAGGAEVHATGCNPLSTQDDVAAGLASMGVETYAMHGVNAGEYRSLLVEALSCCPDLLIDDGGDLLDLLSGDYAHLGKNLLGGAEETTTGIHRLHARARAGVLSFPMMNVNDAKCKHYYDNKYGTGQSVWDAVMHTTNLLVAGKTVVVAGYGYCGRGVAMRAKGMGANVIVTEIDPIKALEASMDGCRVMPMDEAAPQGDLFVTTTGCRDVLTRRHFEVMKNNAFLSNAGHFNVEVDCEALADMAVRVYPRRQDITGYELADGRTLNLLAEGRLVNLASGNGHPAEIMDTSFSVQALALEYLLHHASELGRQVYDIPEEIDREVSRLKLHGAGLHIDALTPEQEAFARKRLIAALDHYGWRLGTGFLSTPMILDVLAGLDISYAYRLLENEEMPGWLFMPKSGATTIWEAWEGNQKDKWIASLNHYSKGAVCEWLMNTMCGIRITGENHVTIAPKPGGDITFARASYWSICGNVTTSWERTENGYRLTVGIPANTTAEILLPDGTGRTVGAGQHRYEWK